MMMIMMIIIHHYNQSGLMRATPLPPTLNSLFDRSLAWEAQADIVSPVIQGPLHPCITGDTPGHTLFPFHDRLFMGLSQTDLGTACVQEHGGP